MAENPWITEHPGSYPEPSRKLFARVWIRRVNGTPFHCTGVSLWGWRLFLSWGRKPGGARAVLESRAYSFPGFTTKKKARESARRWVDRIGATISEIDEQD